MWGVKSRPLVPNAPSCWLGSCGLAALASQTAVERQLPISADTGWIWRLFFHRLYGAVLFLYFPLPAARVLTGKNSLLRHGAEEAAARAALVSS